MIFIYEYLSNIMCQELCLLSLCLPSAISLDQGNHLTVYTPSPFFATFPRPNIGVDLRCEKYKV